MPQRDIIRTYEKQKQALNLALAGVDYQTIAERLGYNSRQAAWKAVRSALSRTIKPAADELREMQIGRIDAMLRSIWKDVLNGNQGAIDRALRLEERRAKLLGLDAPERQEISGPAGGPIETAAKRDYSKLTDAEVNTLEEIEKKAAGADGQ